MLENQSIYLAGNNCSVRSLSINIHYSSGVFPVILKKLSLIRFFLLFAGHVSRHSEPSGSLIFWTPEEPRRRGRPNITLNDVLKADTGLNSNEMRGAVAHSQFWKTNFVMSPI